MNIVAIIQARMSASRLPGKVLLDIGGKPMLQWVVERTRQAKTIGQVVVATTTDLSDEPVEGFCRAEGIAFTRGSVNDVLDRYYQAANEYNADVVVRITADCPFIDPGLLDQTVGVLFISPNGNHKSDHNPLTTAYWDFVANRLPKPWWRSYPIGLDAEVFTRSALERAWQQAKELHQREHVTPYFYDDVPFEDLKFSADKVPVAKSESPKGFKVGLLHHHEELGHHRWTVDTPQDLAMVREIASRLPKDQFTWLDIIDLLEREPELTQINAEIQHKTHLDVDDRQR